MRTLTLHETPVEQRIVDERFEHGEHRVLVITQHLQHALARDAIVAVDTRHLQTYTQTRDVTHV